MEAAEGGCPFFMPCQVCSRGKDLRVIREEEVDDAPRKLCKCRGNWNQGRNDLWRGNVCLEKKRECVNIEENWNLT